MSKTKELLTDIDNHIDNPYEEGKNTRHVSVNFLQRLKEHLQLLEKAYQDSHKNQEDSE